MESREQHSEVLTIMFIDVAGYTRASSKMSRDDVNKFHDDFDGIAQPTFTRFGGKIIKKIGDAFLVTFKSPTDAVWCGIELQRLFANYNKEKKPKFPIHIRVALHTGEVIHRNGDIYGDAVNTTARIESVAKEGHIVFSEAFFLALNKGEMPFLYLGAKKMKGLKYPIKLFRVKGAYDDIIRRRMKVKKTFKKMMGALFWLVFVLILAGLLIYAYLNYNYLIRLFGL